MRRLSLDLWNSYDVFCKVLLYYITTKPEAAGGGGGGEGKGGAYRACE